MKQVCNINLKLIDIFKKDSDRKNGGYREEHVIV